MKAFPRTYASILVAAASLGSVGAFAAVPNCSVVVIGQNDPPTDVGNVQQAVDECDTVFLQGAFDFTDMESGEPSSVIRVVRSVKLIGLQDQLGQMPTIVGGQRPLLIDAPGEDVEIAGLSFVASIGRAIAVGSARSVFIADCTIEDTVQVTIGSQIVAFGITVGDLPPTEIDSLSIVGNRIVDFDDPVEVSILVAPGGGSIGRAEISGNDARAIAHGIDLRDLGGNAKIEGNTVAVVDSLRSGDLEPLPRLVDGIRCLGSGKCRVRGNWIESLHANSAGVRLQSAAGARVEENEVRMTPPAGSVPGSLSAGVQVLGASGLNVVLHNTITGAARSALAVVDPSADTPPEQNMLVGNEHEGFTASLADVEVGEGALRTVIVGEEGSISDLGTGTIVQ